MVSVRTIFLAVRGVDQTGRAFSIIDRRIERLIQKQMKLQGISRKAATAMVKDQNKLLFALREIDRVSYRLIFAGAAFTAFAAMIGWGIMSIIEKSSMGELVIEDFRRALDKLIVSISEAILEQWGPAIKNFIDWLDELSQNETFKMIIGGTAIPITIALALMGITLLVVGIIGKFLALVVGALETAGLVQVGMLHTVGVSALKMAIPLAIAFLVAITLELVKGQIRDSLMDYFFSELDAFRKESPEEAEILEWFITPFDPSKGYMSPTFPLRQLGTTMVSRTGPIIAHEGEVIFNPQLPITPPLQMGGRGVGGPIEITINQHIDSIGVEADEERLARKTAEYIGDEIAGIIG